MRKIRLAVFIIINLILPFYIVSYSSANDIMLPTPLKDGGPDILSAISKRSSAARTSFANKELSLKELSTILWAATGRNRPEKGWTVPMAMGREPYITVYVLLKSGSYIYDWDKNMLKQLGNKNPIPRAGGEEFIGSAPCVFVLATRGKGPGIDSWADIAAGAMSQNIYLASEAFGLKTRFVASFNKETLLNYLFIGPLSRIICIMPIGFQ